MEQSSYVWARTPLSNYADFFGPKEKENRITSSIPLSVDKMYGITLLLTLINFNAKGGSPYQLSFIYIIP